jgi:hypothetical protein
MKMELAGSLEDNSILPALKQLHVCNKKDRKRTTKRKFVPYERKYKMSH